MDKRLLDNYNSESGARDYTKKFERKWTERVNNWHEQRVVRRLIAQIASTDHVNNALDLPCGYGRLMPILRERIPRVFEADWSLSMLKIARSNQRGGSHHHEADAYIRANALEMPFADRSFDLVLSVRLCHHIREYPERLAYVRELLRIGRKWVVFTYFDYYSVKNILREIKRLWSDVRSKWTLKESDIGRIARETGFEIIHSIPLSRLSSGHRYVVLRKKSQAV
jgi:ubiquinone/menaquinone biosynthesis C-methylase UbiE